MTCSGHLSWVAVGPGCRGPGFAVPPEPLTLGVCLSEINKHEKLLKNYNL